MFIVSLTYLAPLAEIDASLEAHRAFLDRHFAAGTFIASGPKIPRTGGVILATAEDRDTLMAVLAEDPFRREGLANYDVIEFSASRFADAVPELLRRSPEVEAIASRLSTPV